MDGSTSAQRQASLHGGGAWPVAGYIIEKLRNHPNGPRVIVAKDSSVSLGRGGDGGCHAMTPWRPRAACSRHSVTG